MSNYFQLISNVSLVKLGKPVASFSDTSKKRYNKIKDAILNAVQDVFLSKQFNFREKQEVLSTVATVNKYTNDYGMIQELRLDTNKLTYKENNIDYLLNTTVTGKPNSYTIFEDNIVLYPLPDTQYNITVITKTDNFIKQVHTVDQSSTSGQNNLYISSTDGLFVGDLITVIGANDVKVSYTVLSVTTNDYVTLTSNLTSTYAIGNTVEKYKNVLEYETDEPRFPSKFHKVIEYHALRQLYFNNAPKLLKYSEMYENFTREMTVSDRGTVKRSPRFVIR